MTERKYSVEMPKIFEDADLFDEAGHCIGIGTVCEVSAVEAMRDKYEEKIAELQEQLRLSKSTYDTNLKTIEWNHKQTSNEWDNERYAFENRLAQAREEALREAAEAVRRSGSWPESVNMPHNAILALIEKGTK